MTSEQLEALKVFVKKDLIINEDNLQKISLGVPVLYHKYLDIFTEEFKVFQDMTTNLKEAYGKLYDKYRFNSDKQLDGKAEIECYIFSDPIYIKKQYDYNVQQKVVKYLEGVLDTISKISFNVNNYVNYRKFLAGVN